MSLSQSKELLEHANHRHQIYQTVNAEKLYQKEKHFYETSALPKILLRNGNNNLTANQVVGANFFSFVFRFLTYLLSCILLLFALRYFVNYAPLLYVLYVNFVIVCYLASIYYQFLRIYQCNNIRRSRLFFCSVALTTNPVILSIWSAASFSSFFH